MIKRKNVSKYTLSSLELVTKMHIVFLNSNKHIALWDTVQLILKGSSWGIKYPKANRKKCYF